MENNVQDFKQNNTMALTSVIAAAVAWLVGGLGSCGLFFLFAPLSLCTGGIFLIGSVTAVVTGHIGRRQIRDGGGLEEGDNLAVIGLVLGYLGIAANVAMLCLMLLGVLGLAAMGPEIGDVFSEIIRELETPMP